MKNTTTRTNKLRTFTFDEVFKKQSPAFKRAYAEESLRIALATQIRDARTAQHLTQAAVAKRSGTPQSVIARLESGSHSISVDTLGKVAHALGKEIALA